MNKAKELKEYIENDEYGEYLEALINLNNFLRCSGDKTFISVVEDQIEKELSYCKENLEIIWHKEETMCIHKWKEIVAKE